MSDEHYMRMALGLAETAARLGEIPVGCVIVDAATREVVGAAANGPVAMTDPTAHAEILALRRAAETVGNYRLRPGLTLYVTLEPCAMCAGAISHARVSRVVYGASDPKGGAVESGVRFFEQPTCHWRPEVTGGVEAEACGDVLKEFFRARR